MSTIKELSKRIERLEVKYNNAVNNNSNVRKKKKLCSEISELSKALAVLLSTESNKYHMQGENYWYSNCSYDDKNVEVNNFYNLLVGLINNKKEQKYGILKKEFNEPGYIGKVHGDSQYGYVHYDYLILAPTSLIDSINCMEDLNNNKFIRILNDAILRGVDLFASSSNIVLTSTFNFYKIHYEIIDEVNNADIYHVIFDADIHKYSNKLRKIIARYGYDNKIGAIDNEGKPLIKE